MVARSLVIPRLSSFLKTIWFQFVPFLFIAALSNEILEEGEKKMWKKREKWEKIKIKIKTRNKNENERSLKFWNRVPNISEWIEFTADWIWHRSQLSNNWIWNPVWCQISCISSFFFFFCLRSCLIRVFINFLFSLLYILSILFFYLWRKTIKLDSFNNCVVTDLIILFISLEHFSEIRY